MTTQIDRFDLVNRTDQEGEVEEKVASGLHGVIGANLISYLLPYVRQEKLGFVFNSTTNFKVAGVPPTRQPAVAFVSLDRMPAPPDEDVPFAPDLAVEVVSRNDTAYEIEKKIEQYQQSGVRLVWIIYPVSRSVEVFRLETGLKSQRLLANEQLDGEKVVPGFKVNVADLFT